ncbi:hypothetical protein DIPPA_18511 [Diplonema papillatum]|nr:hypothetical protein DIPPA_18511 [Diplonema papillatum]
MRSRQRATNEVASPFSDVCEAEWDSSSVASSSLAESLAVSPLTRQDSVQSLFELPLATDGDGVLWKTAAAALARGRLQAAEMRRKMALAGNQGVDQRSFAPGRSGWDVADTTDEGGFRDNAPTDRIQAVADFRGRDPAGTPAAASLSPPPLHAFVPDRCRQPESPGGSVRSVRSGRMLADPYSSPPRPKFSGGTRKKAAVSKEVFKELRSLCKAGSKASPAYPGVTDDLFGAGLALTGGQGLWRRGGGRRAKRGAVALPNLLRCGAVEEALEAGRELCAAEGPVGVADALQPLLPQLAHRYLRENWEQVVRAFQPTPSSSSLHAAAYPEIRPVESNPRNPRELAPQASTPCRFTRNVDML